MSAPSNTLLRALRVTLTLLAALAIAIWVGLKSRPAPKPQPPTTPVAAMSADGSRKLCADRLARLGKALQLYAADHAGAYPVLPGPGEADVRLLPLLKRFGVTTKDLYCPVEEGPGGKPYAYHSYRAKGAGGWPNWMAEKHLVVRKSPADTWLMADYLGKDQRGPHSPTERAFNFLCADGSVKFHTGRPREVYK